MKKVRLARLEDASQMLEIYRPYVLDTSISFEVEPPSIQEFQKRISENIERFPWLVCEVDSRLIGYAYAGAYKSRCAYAWSVETTVYVHQDFHGQGVGKELYLRLLTLLKNQGAVNVIAGIALPNQASVALHESLGFEKVAQFKDVGFKLGNWWDVGYWQLQLQRPMLPKSLRPMCDNPQIEILKCDPSRPEAMDLLNELSCDLAKKTGRDGREIFEFSDVALPRSAFLLACEFGRAVGCGALRPFDDKTCEVKRMYTRTQGCGIGRKILGELERLAIEFQFNRICVETGIENHGAVKFYQTHGYEICENWGKYKGRPECICFQKILNLRNQWDAQTVDVP